VAVCDRRLGCAARAPALRHHAAGGDHDFSNRTQAIKIRFVRAIPPTERHSRTRAARGERAIWQRRSWEHAIRNDIDYARHVDYGRFNPVKHG